MTEELPPLLKCDTCGAEAPLVSRVVVDAGYNRANSRAVYNCPACYDAKLRQREQSTAAVEPRA